MRGAPASACRCDLRGTAHTICNHETGECDCFAGVGERVCSQCLPDYYGYDDTTFEGICFEGNRQKASDLRTLVARQLN